MCQSNRNTANIAGKRMCYPPVAILPNLIPGDTHHTAGISLRTAYDRQDSFQASCTAAVGQRELGLSVIS